MCIAFVGPIGDHSRAAIELVSRSFGELGASRVIYVGGDDAIERLVSDFVGSQMPAGAPSAPAPRLGFWERTLVCRTAGPEDIDDFLVAEERVLPLLHVEVPTEEAWNRRELATLGGWKLVPSRSGNDVGGAGAHGMLHIVLGPEARPNLGEDGHRGLTPGNLDEAGLLVVDEPDPSAPPRMRLFDRNLQLLATRTCGGVACAAPDE